MPLFGARTFGIAHHGVVQHVAHLLFAAHQLDVVVIAGKLRVQRLDRDDPPRNLVARPKDLTRVAPTQLPLDLVGVVQHLTLTEDVSGQGSDHSAPPAWASGPVFTTGAAKTFAMRKFPE